MLSDNLPAEKMGVYMGIFNFFIVIPQLLAASVLGFLLRTFMGGAPVVCSWWSAVPACFWLASPCWVQPNVSLLFITDQWPGNEQKKV